MQKPAAIVRQEVYPNCARCTGCQEIWYWRHMVLVQFDDGSTEAQCRHCARRAQSV